jgi:hypothetical protein
MTIKNCTAVLTLLLLMILPAFTDSNDDRVQNINESADNMEISLVFIGPADALYSWWGHVALVVTNTQTGRSRYYDYGNFSFEQDSFVQNFVMGRLYFLKMGSEPERQIRYSVYLNRDVTVYKLNVSHEREIELYKFLENDILPENRVYLYDHFYDNCSTRIRDMMDILTEGEFSKTYNVLSDKTLRTQLRRFIYNHPLMDWLLNFAMNGSVDRGVTEFDGMYLPLELERGITKMMIQDEKGQLIPFVREIDIVNKAVNRSEVKAYPPPQWPYGLAIGAVLAIFSRLLIIKSEKKLIKQKGLGAFSAILSFIFAVPGTVLFFMAFFTDHSFAYWNMNLLFVNPFLFVTFVMSLRLIFSNKELLPTLRRCWTITAAGGLLSIILKIIPICRQDNWETILLVILPAAVLSGLLDKRKDNVKT